MKLIDIARIALSTFVNNKMRTVLTIFGISIGIGAIIFLVSIGFGLQEITIGEIQSIKALKTYNITSGDSSILSMDNETIDKFKKITNVVSVNPSLSLSGQIGLNNTKTDVLINSASAEYLDLESPRMDAGGIYSSDNDGKVVVTGVIASAFNLSPDSLVGKQVKVVAYVPDPKNPKILMTEEKEFTVSGVIKDSAASYIYLPIGAISIPAGSQYSVIKVKVDDTKHMLAVKSEIVGLGYKASSIGEKVDQMNQVFNIAKIVLLVFGAIALIVASIGMFNTLTISLLERTKDIGVMKALGATDREIYLIFLAEASTISVSGGLAGIASALIAGNLLNFVVSSLATRAGGESVKPFQAPVQFIGIILGFSIIVGLLTGLYLAKRAAKLNPLDALRYE
jgi:putative ABC transport system permease protein